MHELLIFFMKAKAGSIVGIENIINERGKRIKPQGNIQ